MPYDSCLVNNSVVFARFEHLEEKGRAPQLAVFRGHLFVTYCKPNSLFERVYQIFKTIILFALNFLGFVDQDPASIHKIKDQIDIFHYEQATKHKSTEIQVAEEIIKTLSKKQETLELKNIELEKYRQTLIAKAIEKCDDAKMKFNAYTDNLEKKIREGGEKLESIKTEYESAEKLVLQKTTLEKETASLQESKEQLSSDIESLKTEKDSLKKQAIC